MSLNSNLADNNKRIAINTVYLYIRMIVTLVVTLYTSRVVLLVLGIEDFGVYNLVAGVVVLFSFLNSAITNGIQRFITFALGKGDKEYERKIFTTSFVALLILALVLVALCESVGLWLLNHKLLIPEGKLPVANTVFQISLAVMVVEIFRTPYNALIIAYERMNFFAYVSILEAALKLSVVFALYTIAGNKLLIYALLLLFVAVVVNGAYMWFCKRKIPVSISRRAFDGHTLRELGSFSGWNLLGGVADIGYQQGTNMILNIFCGVTLNATMGITNQVKNSVFNFARNLLAAANPQIIKSYANGERAYLNSLLAEVSKYSFFLIYFTSMPLILNMDLVLNVWLKTPPPYAVYFCNLMLGFCMIDTFVSPLWTAAQAEGNIRTYQIVSSLILLLNVPLAWLVLRLGAAPYSIIVVQICVAIPGLIYRVWYLKHKEILVFREYLKKSLLPVLAVVVITAPVLYFISIGFEGWSRLFVSAAATVVLIPLAVLFIGMNKEQRHKVLAKLKSKL